MTLQIMAWNTSAPLEASRGSTCDTNGTWNDPVPLLGYMGIELDDVLKYCGSYLYHLYHSSQFIDHDYDGITMYPPSI